MTGAAESASTAAVLTGSALAQAGISIRHWTGRSLELTELTHLTLARLYSLAPAAALAASADCGVALPDTVNGCAGRDPAGLCLAPGEWLLSSASLDFGRLAARLAPALAGPDTLLLDHSAGLATFRLAGAAAPWLLQKLCGLDLGRAVTRGRFAAQTRLDHAALILHYHEPDGAGPRVFDLLFDRSLARYLWSLLLLSAPHAEELYSRHGVPA